MEFKKNRRAFDPMVSNGIDETGIKNVVMSGEYLKI